MPQYYTILVCTFVIVGSSINGASIVVCGRSHDQKKAETKGSRWPPFASIQHRKFHAMQCVHILQAPEVTPLQCAAFMALHCWSTLWASRNHDSPRTYLQRLIIPLLLVAEPSRGVNVPRIVHHGLSQATQISTRHTTVDSRVVSSHGTLRKCGL